MQNELHLYILTASVNIKGDCLKKLFGSLAQLSCLESLCLESPIRMDDSAARKFARLLVTTKTLKRVQINDCNAKKGALEIVMQGLKKNQSVSHMEMEFSATRTSWTNAFVNMLKGNKTLTHFGHITTKKSELRYIAEELHANHFLTSLNIWEQPGYEEDIFAINEILRRNAAHLNRAVEFALDPEKYGVEREPAESFEELCETQTFQNHLSRVVGLERASEAMRNARRHITTNLFAIAGVCQGPVTCWPHPKVMKRALLQHLRAHKACKTSRCLIEGEAVYDAGQVVECAVEAVTGDRITVAALILRTRALPNTPHNVSILIDCSEVANARSSYKAGRVNV
ncbi:hypothetical protein HPB51_011840 [Rhipicephalus microplus]|uniref:Uncharacterized protein n=1 Tax=Rhipicephalus microplus TaxID=6941 RepID=A0A9J6E935_RHIMP|nr:hypothetical protein HPB51_011840 [Rhipicephalus microplus]